MCHLQRRLRPNDRGREIARKQQMTDKQIKNQQMENLLENVSTGIQVELVKTTAVKSKGNS